MSKLLKLSVLFGLFMFVLTVTSSTYAVSDNSSDNAQEKIEQVELQTQELRNANKNTEVVGAKKDKMMVLKDDKSVTTVMRKVNKLSEARLKVCVAKEKNIESRLKTLLALGENTHKGKEKMVKRVDKYYTGVLVPAGYTLPNYAVLKSDIEAKKGAVADILAAAQFSGQEFSCESDDPKGQTDEFKANIQSLIAANKAYKNSVKNFVVAVRDLSKKAKSDTMNISPVISPMVSETVTPVVSPGITATP